MLHYLGRILIVIYISTLVSACISQEGIAPSPLPTSAPATPLPITSTDSLTPTFTPTSSPTPTPPATSTLTPTATLPPVEPDAYIPDGLGDTIFARRLGPDNASVTIHDDNTVFGPMSVNLNGEMFRTEKGREFFYGDILGKAFGYDDAETYLAACASGEAQTISLDRFWVQSGPITVHPCKVTWVFERKITSYNWYPYLNEDSEGFVREIKRQNGYLPEDIQDEEGQQALFFKLEIVDDRVILHVSYDGTDLTAQRGHLPYMLAVSWASIGMWLRAVLENGGLPPFNIGHYIAVPGVYYDNYELTIWPKELYHWPIYYSSEGTVRFDFRRGSGRP